MGGYYLNYFNSTELDMEHTERTIEAAGNFIHPYEYEKASNSYLMAVVSVIAGMPLPIINVIAAIGFYLANRKSSYFVRWHCIQSAIGQAVIIPFNSVAVAWTVSVFFSRSHFFDYIGNNHTANASLFIDEAHNAPIAYWLYMAFIFCFNLAEFFIIIYTATRVRNGHDVRWFGIAGLTDSLCSKEDRNPYKI
jgi:uncharacterized membrane protein